MKNQKMGPLIFILVTLLICTMLGTPLAVAAREWWIMEVTYTLQGRMPENITGPQSRIYLPEVIAVLSDGIEMDVNYQVTKDEEILASGAYTRGAFFDLNGAGTYIFTYKGVDAANSYSFEVMAVDDRPSIVLERELVEKSYTDEVVNLPSAKIIWNDTENEARVKLVAANGKEYIPADKVIPESGTISVVYFTDIDGIEHKFTYELDVLDRNIGFYDSEGKFYPAAEQVYPHMDLSGCVLDDVSCLTYTFSEIIDLSAATKDIPLIVLNNASTEGRTTPKVKLVDIYDSQNYIEITGRWSADNDTVVYSVAKAPNQEAGGMSDGAFYTQLVFGTLTTFPTSHTADKTHPAKYYYDAKENAVYTNWYGSVNLMNDFDAEYQLFPWSGFTTGEVYIVVERSSSTDFICVESVAGYSLSSYTRDNVAPNLLVNVENEANIPTAVVGMGYPLFAAEAFDFMDSAVDVSVHVYKGYDAENGIELPVFENKFVPYEAGYYTIVYSASDRYANQSEYRLNVLALDESEAKLIEANIQAPVQSAYVGEEIQIYAPTDISGGNGEVSYTVYLSAADGSEQEITGNIVTIPTEGKNVIRYVFKDYIGITKEYAFDVQATVSQNPILHKLVMPKTLRSEKIFVLPEARYTANSDVKITIEAYLNGKALDVFDGTVTPVAENSGDELLITYKATSATGSTEMSYSIKMLCGDISDRTTFFIPSQGNMAITQEAESIRFTTQESYSSVQFANALMADKFKISLSVDPEQNHADMITVRLQDSLDPNICVKLDIVKQNDVDAKSKSYLYINGIKANRMAGNFYGGVEALQLCYSSKTYGITDAVGSTAGIITRTENGEIFSGFPSGEVNVTISVGNVETDGFSFSLLQINNQSFFEGDMFFDSYAELSLQGTLALQADVGSTITIPAARVSDVLSPNAEVTVSVKRDSEIVLDKQSADEEFSLTVDSYGKYLVSYQYTDGCVSRSANYSVSIIEHTPPEVVLPKNLPNQAELDQKVTLSMPQASDDYTQEVTVSVIVMEPNGNLMLINQEEMYFVARYTGNYQVIYHVYDECFNYQTFFHTVEVTDSES